MSDKSQHLDRALISNDIPDRDEVADARKSSDLLDQAIAWHSRNGIDDPDSGVFAEFQEWRQRSPAHQRAAEKVSNFMADDGFDSLLAGLETELQSQSASPVRQLQVPNSHARKSRRSMAGRGIPVRQIYKLTGMVAALSVAVAIVLTSLGLLGDNVGDQRLVAARQPLHQTLSDGSRITLAPGAVLSWTMSPGERHLRLEEGAVTITATPDKNRPMIVSTDHSDVTVVGTQFIVINDLHGDEVGVIEGIVRVREHQSDRLGEVTLTAGQGVMLDQTGKLIRRDFSAAQIGSVSQGWRSFTSKSLADVAAAIRRQSGMKLVIDPGISDRLVRGRFNVGDGEMTIGLLAQSLKLSRYDLPFGYVFLTDRI